MKIKIKEIKRLLSNLPEAVFTHHVGKNTTVKFCHKEGVYILYSHEKSTKPIVLIKGDYNAIVAHIKKMWDYYSPCIEPPKNMRNNNKPSKTKQKH